MRISGLQVGAYLPGVYEQIIGVVEAIALTDTAALHVRAKRTFTDIFGKERRTGEEWPVAVDSVHGN